MSHDPAHDNAPGSRDDFAQAAGRVDRELLAALAPVITEDNGAAADFLRTVYETPHAAIGHAQTEALSYIWDALERADAAITTMPDAARPDIPFTAAGLRALSHSVTRNMCVAQTQMPLIIPDGLRLSRHLDESIMDSDEYTDAGMESFSSFVIGSKTEVSWVSGPETAHRRGMSRFGFALIQKEERHESGNAAASFIKLLALPVITIDDVVMEQTMKHEGEGILRHLQMIAGLFNHDYFHHFTARIINPYFGERAGALNIGRTPYGLLMGAEHRIPVSDPQDIRKITARGPEQTTRFNSERYGHEDPVWTAFNIYSPYEFHALHLHNVLYRDYLDHGPAGKALREHVTGYMDGVADLAASMRRTGSAEGDIQSTQFYYATLLSFHLLRLVPFGHPVMKLLEDKIAESPLNPVLCRRNLERALNDARGNKYERLAARTGVILDPRWRTVPETAEFVRACAFFAAERVLNPIYHARYEPARAYALAAMRQNLSVVQRDMNIVERRGGLDAACHLLATEERRRRAGPAPA